MVTKELKEKLKFKGLNRAILILFVLLGITYFATYLNSQKIINVPIDVILMIKALTYIITVFLIATLFIRVTVNRIFKVFDEVEIEHRILISKTYSMIIYSIGILIVLWRLGLSIQNLTLIAGFLATGLAFAVRDIIMSYLAWLILLTKKPFRIGDNIRIGEDEGKVMHIGTFHVIVDDTPDERKEYKRIPNRVFLEKTIQNFGPDRMKYTFTVPISSIPKNIKKIFEKIQIQVKKETKIDVKLYLDANSEKILVYAVFRSDFSKKLEVKNSIIENIGKYIL